MRQTDSAMRMLISAYKAVLAKCYIKETLAGGVKRFCKGVALSSFLTAVLAGVSFPSFASSYEVEYQIEKDINENFTESVTVTGANEEHDVIKLDKKDSDYEVKISTSSESDGNIVLDGKGTAETPYLEADGIHITDAPVAGNVELDAAQNIEINVGNNGIDNSGAVTVDIKAKGEVKIDAGIGQTSAEGDGARLEGSGSIAISGNNTNIKGHDEGLYIHEKTTSQEGIKVTASGADENGFGNIIAGNDNGIESAGTAGIDVSAVNGSNRIFGVNSAILNSGSVPS